MVKYLISASNKEYYFSQELCHMAERLATRLPLATEIMFYPDATYIEKKGLATGMLVKSDFENTILLPGLLQDTGCGFLMFACDFYKNPPKDWQAQVRDIFDQVVNGEKKLAHTAKQFNLKELWFSGLNGLPISADEKRLFLNPTFEVDRKQIILAAAEIDQLIANLPHVSNSIELKVIYESNHLLKKYDLKDGDFIGFLHSGCGPFAQMIRNRFNYEIAKYGDTHGLFSLDDISVKIFGVPINCELGSNYYEWHKAAMNYAICNRYLGYLTIKEQIEKKLPCQLRLINDVIHAGVIEEDSREKKIIKSCRGVQNCLANSESLHIIAGHRETISALVTTGPGAEKEAAGMLPHGTSYQIDSTYNYNNYFELDEAEKFLAMAKDISYNSLPKYERCLPYTYNLLTALDYFKQQNIVEQTAYLAPVVNVLVERLKGL